MPEQIPDWADVLTPEQWRAIGPHLKPIYARAFKMCEHCCELDIGPEHPLYYFCGQLLAAAIELRRVADVAVGKGIMPDMPRPRSMMWWVMPHCGGGVVPQEAAYFERDRGPRLG